MPVWSGPIRSVYSLPVLYLILSHYTFGSGVAEPFPVPIPRFKSAGKCMPGAPSSNHSEISPPSHRSGWVLTGLFAGRTIQEKFPAGFALKKIELIPIENKIHVDPAMNIIIRSYHNEKISHNPSPLRSLKTPFFKSSLALPSGHATAPVPPNYQNKAQNEPRSGEDHPLSDRKLLEELHEEGVRKDA
jgi:hypothetical protein